MTDKTDIAAIAAALREIVEHAAATGRLNRVTVDGRDLESVLDALDATMAELAALRGEQEPVAWMKNSEVTTAQTTADVWLADQVGGYGDSVTELFTRPPVPVVMRKIGHIDHDGGEYGEYFVELTDSAEIGRAVYVIEEGEDAGITVKGGE